MRTTTVVHRPEQVELVQRLFLAHYNVLRGFVFSILPNATIAEDIVHETFLTATDKASDFQPGTNFVAWVCSIARFHVLRARRNFAQTAHRSLSEAAVELLAISVPDDAFETGRAQALAACLERLPRRLREVIRLRYESGFGPTEIGSLLQCTTDSVNSALGKARSMLRSCVQRELKRQELA